jgi:hypothetical protein
MKLKKKKRNMFAATVIKVKPVEEKRYLPNNIEEYDEMPQIIEPKRVALRLPGVKLLRQLHQMSLDEAAEGAAT